MDCQFDISFFVTIIDVQFSHRNAVGNSDILVWFQEKGNLFLQSSHYSENIISHLEVGRELMYIAHTATFISVRYAKSANLPLKKPFLSILYQCSQFADPQFEKILYSAMEIPFFGLQIYSHTFAGTVKRLDKPVKNQTTSLSKQDLTHKKCADQR